MENCRGREKREWKRTGGWVGGRWKRVAGDGNELLYHKITPVLLERKDTCMRVGRRPRRHFGVPISRAGFHEGHRVPRVHPIRRGGGRNRSATCAHQRCFSYLLPFFFLKHSLAQRSPKSPMRPCLCSPKFPALCETSRKRMCLGNTLCLCNFVAPRYAQTNPNQARCIKAPSTLAAPVTPVVFPSLVWSLSSPFMQKNPIISFTSQWTNSAALVYITPQSTPENLRKQAPVCPCCNQKGAWWGSTKPAFNFPSHNAALQCFDISHKTQLAFQIRALTFGWRQADWYLHNLDGLSVLCCPRPFVSNVHTHRDDYRLWVNFSHRWL